MAPSTAISITRADLAAFMSTALTSAHITSVRHLASYNWLASPTPTIGVPGIPPLWTSTITSPQRVPKDTGHVYIAQNAARHPTSPLEPLFRALFTENPDFDIGKIDVVSDRNNVRKLLSFVDDSTAKNGLEDFVIKAEAIEGTVVLSRVEERVEEVIGANEFKGYGHEFEKACTSNEVEGSTGHHRIVRFEFGGLGFIVRHETDGYVGGFGGVVDQGEAELDKDDLELLDWLEKLSLEAAAGVAAGPIPGSKMTLKLTGRQVPRTSTLEIKTRVAHKPIAFDEVASQLWVSQTPKLVRAYHVKGLFNVPVVEDMTAALKKWEGEKQESLVALAALIKKILEVIKEYGQAVIRYDKGVDKLMITPEKTAKMLPHDLYLKWKDGNTSREEANEGTAKDNPIVDGKDGEEEEGANSDGA